jgi:SPASM domain peptide maturase of grasp-with-spasm system
MVYPNIVTVKGYNRSIILDLYKKRFRYIPNLLAEILSGLNEIAQTKENVLSKVDSNSHHELMNQIEVLLSEDYLLMGDEILSESLKVPMSQKREESLITDCVMEISQDSSYSLKGVLKALDRIGVKYLEIRFLDSNSFRASYQELQESLEDSTVEYLHILAPFDLSICTILSNEYKTFERLNLFTFYNAQNSISLGDLIFELHFSSQPTIDPKMCGCISPAYFTFNLQSYQSNRIQNSCLSRKLSIDSMGKIKNCPSKSNNYGNLEQVDLESMVQSIQFQQDWETTKDKILICSDCEFRWNCSDCRVFIQDQNNPFSKPSKCQYNPYISKWEWEEGYLPEQATGISILENQLVIDTEKLDQINSLLWA